MAELDDALAAVPPEDAPYDWQDAPLQAPPDVAVLARDLAAAGLDAGRAAVLRDGADRAAAAWEGIAGGCRVRSCTPTWLCPTCWSARSPGP